MLLAIILIVVVIFVVNKEESRGHMNSTHSNVEWLKKYPQLGNVEKVESGLLITGDIVIKKDAMKANESRSELEGKITNPFGIRDDILEYIIKTVPVNNESALRAAIKLNQDDQQIYYGDLTEDQAMKLVDNQALILTCLIKYLPNNADVILGRGIDSLMRNTKARDGHLWAVDRKYFSWKVIGSGLSVADEDNACAKGEF